jgi:hypothetical protein
MFHGHQNIGGKCPVFTNYQLPNGLIKVLSQNTMGLLIDMVRLCVVANLGMSRVPAELLTARKVGWETACDQGMRWVGWFLFSSAVLCVSVATLYGGTNVL